MAIKISGDGSITGISTGGLPDGTITAAELSTKTFVSYAIIQDQKAQNTPGGSFTSGDWRTRDLNTVVSDADSIVSLSNNQFTLGAGTYLIRWSAPAYTVEQNQTRLYNATTPGYFAPGTIEYTRSSTGEPSRSTGEGRITIASPTAFEVRHVCVTTSAGANGFGVPGGFTTEVYTSVEIYKEA